MLQFELLSLRDEIKLILNDLAFCLYIKINETPTRIPALLMLRAWKMPELCKCMLTNL